MTKSAVCGILRIENLNGRIFEKVAKMKKSEIKKEIILNEAQKIFARYGLLKTTVDEIAHAARMGKASWYHYFESKEDIFKEVIESESRFLNEKVHQAVDGENSSREKIKAHIKSCAKYFGQLPNINSALHDNYLDHYAFIKEIRKRFFQEEMEIIKDILSDGVKKGTFRIRDIELTSFAVVSALKGIQEHPRSLSASLAEKEQYIDKLTDLLFEGILKR